MGRPQIIQIRGSLRRDLRRRALFGDRKLGPGLKRVSDRAARLVEPAETYANCSVQRRKVGLVARHRFQRVVVALADIVSPGEAFIVPWRRVWSVDTACSAQAMASPAFASSDGRSERDKVS
jgi:hypothetical protein